ncbi:serine/threonine-protein phosphatase 6 regulatory ankyrin repeat subunit A-like isoform X1 [Haliotis rufescens]|uniref:serine/threonine-protein phosphatase 6 regulatory ankyrin repeat subunit A-like isoform X1 n=2 Tax=Haliotis rufescens TaxID=6454 RepID=UPI00201E85A3|nr:serine/threonine-protein phosphatase 6 regulatory ankyrin repeat subunit A-like isoform X1 [Haliotis rufescens]
MVCTTSQHKKLLFYKLTPTMAEPEAITESHGSRPDDGDQTQTVLYYRTSDETVMTSMTVTDPHIPDGAHGRIASIQNIGPPQITDPDFQQAMQRLSLLSVPSGVNHGEINIMNVFNDVTVTRETSYGAVNEIPDMVREKMKSAKDIFVETEAYENVYDALEHDGHVLISGSPGSGKTTMALYIMDKYRRKKYHVQFEDDVADFKVEDHVNLKVPTLLVLDDVFGRFAPTSEKKVRCTKIFDYLKTHFKSLEEKRKKTQDEDKTKGVEASEITLKVIMSSRTNICKHQIVTTMLNKYKTSLFRQSTIADLTISELKEHEKESILRKHLVKSKLDLTEHDIKTITRLEYKTLGFPYICQLFADSFSSKDEAVKFFMEPWAYLYDLISNIFSSDDPNYRAAVLLLMVLNDGTLNLIQLQQARPSGRNIELRHKIAKVEEILPGVCHPNQLNKAAKNEIRTLLVSEGDTMSFSHPTIYDVVAFAVGDTNPDFVLENCSLKFIIERTKVSEDHKTDHPSGGDIHSFMINLRQGAAVGLVERLTREIVDGYIALPLSHQCFSRADMAEYLFTNLSSHGNIEQYLHSCDKQHGMGFLYWSSFSSTGPVSKMSFEHTDFSVHEIREGYLGCCMSGNLSSLRVLIENSKNILDKVASTDVGDILGIKQETRQLVRSLSACSPTKTEVPSAIETPRSHGDNKDKLIHIATAYGFTAIVELLLDLVGIHIDARGGNDMTAIMYACYLGHKELAQILLQRQADLELLDEEGDNCLHLACRGGSIAIVQLLLDKNMDINKHGEHARTPLMYASYNGHGDLVRLLLKYGAKAEPDLSSIEQKDTCLHLACVKGETGVVRILLDQGAMGIEVIGGRERTPLMYACRHGRLETAKELVDRNARPNVLDEGNMNCLHLAAMKGHIPTAEWLLGLNVGLTVDSVNSVGRTPLMYAMKNGQAEMVDFFIANGAKIAIKDHKKFTCLHMAAMSGMWHLLEVCLQNGLDVNSLTEPGWTPVMGACKGGQIDLVKGLVARGANVNLGGGCLYAACTQNCLEMVKYIVSNVQDINERGPKNRTAVMTACFHGYIDIVEYLQSCGADMTCKDEYEQTCLHVVCRSSANLQLVEKLVKLLPIDDVDANGITPLMYAVRSDSPELIGCLVRNGANIYTTNTTDSRWQTNLHTACWFGNRNACAKLLDLGMDVDVLDSMKRTPLMSLAKSKKDCTVIEKLLVERRADINVRDQDDNTVLHVSAKWGGHPAFARYILEKGMDVNTLGAYDHSPVMSACRSGNTLAFDLYLANGALLHLTNAHGASCLHLACMVDTDDAHIVNELLDRRADINAQDEQNKTPAMYAISKGSVHILGLLLARNASLTAFDKRGNATSLLHYACNLQGMTTEKIELLLQKRGLRVNEPTMYHSQTPLMLAARQGNQAVVDLLLNSGADPRKVDRNRRNCVYHAQSQGHHELAEYLADRLRRRYHRY